MWRVVFGCTPHAFVCSYTENNRVEINCAENNVNLIKLNKK
ncbi:hypothetical protein HMPREF9231_1267 [Gardnerella vaginalis HMP9231]|nr:hypothetical protein HMPREF9231_1267 [Gardnerella vaginalis HMP9231]